MCVNLLKNSLCKMLFARLLVILFSIQCVTSKINQYNPKKVQLQITLNNSYYIILVYIRSTNTIIKRICMYSVLISYFYFKSYSIDVYKFFKHCDNSSDIYIMCY